MEIIFDSNVWEKVVSSESEPYVTIRKNIENEKITPFICEVSISLESIKKKYRARFFESYEPIFEEVHHESDKQSIRGSICFKPNNDSHPPLPKILLQKLDLARVLGFKVIRMNRYGTVRTNEIPQDMYYDSNSESMEEFWHRADLFVECAEFISMLGAGQAEYNEFVEEFKIQARSVSHLPKEIPADQHKRFSKAVAEWADGDLLAACYQNDIQYLCSDDRGKNAGSSSAFATQNLAMISECFNINILSSCDAAQL